MVTNTVVYIVRKTKVTVNNNHFNQVSYCVKKVGDKCFSGHGTGTHVKKKLNKNK